ncbi:MAG: hypothetical protein PVG73_01360, partial [Desulfobacterales bacterium]
MPAAELQYKKFQISSPKWFGKPFDRLTVLSRVEGLTTTLSQVEGQNTITEIQNLKQLAFDFIEDLDIVFWNLFVIWCLSFVISLRAVGSDLRAGGRFILIRNYSTIPSTT